MRILKEIASCAPRLCPRATPRTSPPCPEHPQPSLSKVFKWPLEQEPAPRDQQLVKHFLFIVARVENHRHDVELMVAVLGGLAKLRSDIELLVLIESQACCVRGFDLIRE
jgi:hypothetical protein